jgi:hypothetical protein
MGILRNLFALRRTRLKRPDIPEAKKVSEFVMWFVRNDPQVRTISNPGSNMIFDEGHRPILVNQRYLHSLAGAKSLAEWFVSKLFIDLNILKEASKAEFEQFIDDLVKSSTRTLSTTMEIGLKYSVDFQNFVYKSEIQKVPEGRERELFQVNYLSDNVLASEVRILAWLYHDYFGKWYKVKEKK